MFEWYDYTLYSAFIPVFTQKFFPQFNGNFGSFIAAFGVFAIGYIARPIGGLLFGYIGDSVSRLFALKMSVWGMTISASLMGLLPTYESVGSLATVLLVLLRVCQGISIGGEFGSSSAYLVENAPKGRKNLYGSFVMLSLAAGVTMGSVMFLIVNFIFTKEELFNWAWRLPFLFSILLGLILVKIRSDVKDDNASNNDTDLINAVDSNNKLHSIQKLKTNSIQGLIKKESKKQKQHTANSFHSQKIKSIWLDFKRNKKNALIAFCASLGDGVPFYILTITFSSTLESVLQYSYIRASSVFILTMFSYGIATLLSGFLGDRFSTKRMMQIGSLLLCVIPFISFQAFSVNIFLVTCVLSCIGGFIVGIYHGSLPYFLLQLFPAESRTTIMSLTYGVGMAFFGSTAPMVFYVLLSKFNNWLLLVPLFVSVSSLIAFVAINLQVKRFRC
ncbi:MAG: MFS transporter [Alphaproteobacteria bacterium]|nr:MFS transporter [Rickettsiales bacterium]